MAMDENPYAAPESREDRPRVEAPSPQSLVQTIRQGAWTGAKWSTIIVGPLAVLLFVVLAGAAVVDAVAFKSTGLNGAKAINLTYLLTPFVLYPMCCLHAAVFGAITNGLLHVVRAVTCWVTRGFRNPKP